MLFRSERGVFSHFLGIFGGHLTKSKKKQLSPEQTANLMKNLNFDELVQKLIAESPIEGEATKLLLAESAAACRFELRVILAKQQRDGKLLGDEVRVIPGLTSNMRRLLERLGTTTLIEEEFEF